MTTTAPHTGAPTCRRCGRPVTAPASVALRLGPACIRRAGPAALAELVTAAAAATEHLQLDLGAGEAG